MDYICNVIVSYKFLPLHTQAAIMAVGWQVNDRRRLHHYAFILTLYNENPGEIKSVLERFLRKSPGHFYGGGVVVGINF